MCDNAKALIALFVASDKFAYVEMLDLTHHIKSGAKCELSGVHAGLCGVGATRRCAVFVSSDGFSWKGE